MGYCVTNENCRIRYDCVKGECICNFEMMYYGNACEKTELVVIIGQIILLSSGVLLFCFTMRVFIIILKTTWAKAIRHRKKLIAPIYWTSSNTSSLLVLISLLWFILLCLSNVCRALNVGNQDIEEHFLTPVSFSIYSAFTISSLLHICFLWIELGYTSVEVSKHKNVTRSKKILFFFSVLYFILMSILFSLTFNYEWVAVLLFVYIVFIGIGIYKGSSMIKMKLQIKRTTLMTIKPAFSLFRSTKHMRSIQNEQNEEHSESHKSEESLALPDQDSRVSVSTNQNKRLLFTSLIRSKSLLQNRSSRSICSDQNEFMNQYRPFVSQRNLSTPKISSKGLALRTVRVISCPNLASTRTVPETVLSRSSACSQTSSIPVQTAERKRVSVVRIGQHPATKKILNCARKIMWLIFFFCVPVLAYHFLVRPEYKYYLFFCQWFAMLDILVIHICILQFLSPSVFRLQLSQRGNNQQVV